MKRIVPLLLAVMLTFCGCARSLPETESEPLPPPETAPSAATKPADVTQPPAETAPLHSDLYLEGLSADALILYFEEVCLEAEIVNSGDPAKVQKWAEPILYQIQGTPTGEDLEQILRFAQWLSTVEGFPGIREAAPEEAPNLTVHFCGPDRMAELLGDWTRGCDGGVTFWYEENKIWSATVCIRTDIAQQVRSSVILEELYNGLGPVQDTELRPDSLIWSGYSEPQWMTAEDMLILRLLYHPTLEPGMDREGCAEAIRALYY